MEHKGTVLLVEDNAELNANNTRALHMLSYDAHSALTLAEARNWLAKREPDVILLDVMLPDGDGIDFCAEIRGAPLHTAAHILFLTAKSDHADRVRGLADGGDDYITKPFHPEELLARVEAAMRRRSMSHKHKGAHGGARAVTLSPEEKLHAFAAHYMLTEKEREALAHILGKLSIREMAESMGITPKGVEFHITNILLKTGTKRRLDLRQAYADWNV